MHETVKIMWKSISSFQKNLNAKFYKGVDIDKTFTFHSEWDSKRVQILANEYIRTVI